MQELDMQIGMSVLGTDGVELGKVSEVWPYSEGYGYITRGKHELSDYGPIAGIGTLMSAERGYFQVKQGELLGFGGRELFIPFEDVHTTVLGEAVTVACTADNCTERYGTRPKALEHVV